jgi:hypothetical protein
MVSIDFNCGDNVRALRGDLEDLVVGRESCGEGKLEL